MFLEIIWPDPRTFKFSRVPGQSFYPLIERRWGPVTPWTNDLHPQHLTISHLSIIDTCKSVVDKEPALTHLTDVNTSDIEDAVRLGCHCMCNVFDAGDGDVPYFPVVARPDAFLGIPLIEHVPGRHLNALLNAEDVVEVAIDEEAIDKHARAAFLSYSGPLPLSLGRQDGAGPPRVFVPHHVREGFHALYALLEFRGSLRARDLAEASIQHPRLLESRDRVGRGAARAAGHRVQ